MPTTYSCDLLPSVAPPIGDELSRPTAETLIGQVLDAIPRGEAWGTDEAGDGNGASPEQLKVWLSIAAWIAEQYGIEWEVATQAFPSMITLGLADWEEELGLPDNCGTPPESTSARRAAIRAKVAAIGGCSPGYFICIARAGGYSITIEEPVAFECSGSECGSGGGEITATDPESIWIVRPDGYAMFEFESGPGGAEVGDGGTRLASYTDITGLECLLRPLSPVHTQLIFQTS